MIKIRSHQLKIFDFFDLLEESPLVTGETNYLAPKEQQPRKLSGKRTVTVITLESRLTPHRRIKSGIFSLIYGYFLSESFDFTQHDIFMGFLLGVPQLALGFICITIGSRTTASATVGLLMLMETLCGPLWVWLFLNEIPPLSVFIGGGVIISAIILKSFDKNKVTSN